LAVLCCAVLPVNAALAETRAITEKDLFLFQWIGDPQLSQDGAEAAFVGVTADEKRTGYETSLWRVSTRNREYAPANLSSAHFMRSGNAFMATKPGRYSKRTRVSWCEKRRARQSI
jgi:hypothetical protein